MGSARELAHALALNAIDTFGRREADRNVIDEARPYEVRLRVTGTVDGEKVSFPVKGYLHKGFTNPVGGTQRPNVTDLLAVAFGRLSKSRQELLLDACRSNDRLPAPDAADVQVITALIRRLSKKTPRAGSIRLLNDPPEQLS